MSVGVSDTAAKQFGLFPDPVEDQLRISTSRTVERLDLFDLAGKFLIGNSMQKGMDLFGLSHGPYFLRVTFTDGGLGYTRILKL